MLLHLKDLFLSDVSKIYLLLQKIRPFNINKQLAFINYFLLKHHLIMVLKTPEVFGKVIGNLFTALPVKNAINSDSTKSIFIFIDLGLIIGFLK